jgi:hypothetical protein
MALTQSTLAELAATFLANYENELTQTAPLADKAYLRVESAVQAAVASLLLKFGTQEAKENLALTASEEGLLIIGANYGVVRDPATAAILAAQITGTDGTNILGTSTYTGDPNGERYNQEASVIIAGGVATIAVEAQDTGVSGNLNVGDTMTIGAQIAGAASFATVTAITQLGTEEEDLEAYRARVLAEIRSQGGGGNTSDYKEWAEDADGVKEAYPYAGTPTDQQAVYDCSTTATLGTVLPAGSEYQGDSNLETYYTMAEVTFDVSPKTIRLQADVVGIAHNLDVGDTLTLQDSVVGMGTTATVTEEIVRGASYATAKPGDRTVFIEADASLDPDGFADTTLLNSARDTINYDPATGEMRPPLGETNETLWVNSISRTNIFVEVAGLSVDSTQTGNAQADIETALTTYFASVKPYIDGLTAPADRNDLITRLTVSEVVQDALATYGGSATQVEIRLIPSGIAVPQYQLRPGELAKLGGVTYV